MDEKTVKMLDAYNKGLELYRNRDFQGGMQYFEKALEFKPNDGPSQMYIQRCKDYIQSPPPSNWDGVYVMKTK